MRGRTSREEGALRSLAIVLLGMLITCCRSTGYTRRGPAYPPRPDDCSIAVLNGRPPPESYREIGDVHCAGPDCSSTEPEALRIFACRLGAEAIVDFETWEQPVTGGGECVSYSASTDNSPSSCTSYAPTYTYNVTNNRAVGIVWVRRVGADAVPTGGSSGAWPLVTIPATYGTSATGVAGGMAHPEHRRHRHH